MYDIKCVRHGEHLLSCPVSITSKDFRINRGHCCLSVTSFIIITMLRILIPYLRLPLSNFKKVLNTVIDASAGSRWENSVQRVRGKSKVTRMSLLKPIILFHRQAFHMPIFNRPVVSKAIVQGSKYRYIYVCTRVLVNNKMLALPKAIMLQSSVQFYRTKYQDSVYLHRTIVRYLRK